MFGCSDVEFPSFKNMTVEEDGESDPESTGRDGYEIDKEVKTGEEDSVSGLMTNCEDEEEEEEKSKWVCPQPTTEEELKKIVAALKGNKMLPRPRKPKLPIFKPFVSTKTKISGFQKYIDSFQYNMTGTR